MSDTRKTSVAERLVADLKTAMKSGDRPRVSCLRMLRSRLQEREVALRSEHGPGYRLSDEEALEAIGGYAKQRRDSIEAYRRGGREELVASEQAELAIVQEYLPQQLSAEEIRALAREAIAEAGAASPRDAGAVMKWLMPKVKGRADGKQVNRIVMELLGPSD